MVRRGWFGGDGDMSAPLISKGSEEEDEIFVHQDESPLQKMKGVRVLLIDDSEDAFLITRHLISKTSTIEVELEWAPDYETGLMRADDQRYHAYLVDYDLGASNGLELIQELKTRGITAPMILFTGKGSDELDVIAIRRGADDYLDKSEQTPALLGRTVRHAIQRSRDLETRVRLENRLRQIGRAHV